MTVWDQLNIKADLHPTGGHLVLLYHRPVKGHSTACVLVYTIVQCVSQSVSRDLFAVTVRSDGWRGEGGSCGSDQRHSGQLLLCLSGVTPAVGSTLVADLALTSLSADVVVAVGGMGR